MIKAEDLYAATEGGKAVILNIYPQSAIGFSSRRNFSIRGSDDKKPSCTVFQKNGLWFLQDKGGDDQKAYTAIELVRKFYDLSFPKAIEWIAERFVPELLRDKGNDSRNAAEIKPDMQKVAPQNEITVEIRKSGKFTKEELQQLGYQITQEICDMFSLKPVDSYITRANAKGQSWKISSNERYPIYYYDYGTFGKIYQPLGDLRFLWAGKKPESLISGELDFLEMYKKAAADKSGSQNPFFIPADPDDPESEEKDLQWDKLIICSGPSDALNIRRSGYHACWLNSETADLTEYELNILKKVAKNIYILYDIDDTGIANAYRLALRYLDLAVINLPKDLADCRTRKGKPCKDAKDFFMYYRKPEIGNIDDLFNGLVRLSGSLKFWQEKYDKKRNFQGYDINNSQLYAFLQASGFFTIADSSKKYMYCRIKDNIVELIDPSEIGIRCTEFLQNYIVNHPQYYKQSLANAVFRSPQIEERSLRNLKRVEPNFNAFSKDADYFFFRNGIFQVTKDGINKIKPSDCPFMILKSKIIDHDFNIEDSLFDVDFSEEYLSYSKALKGCSPLSPEFVSFKKKADALNDERKYQVKINSPEFDFLRFVYNTGRTYWQKEEAGYRLTEEEQREHDLNFISKVAMLGYMLSKYKDSAKAYGVYAMEMEQGSEGEHRGGTGKSIMMRSVELLRDQVYIDGQGIKADQMDFILQQVKKSITDTIYIDDLNNKIDLHRFMNWITGKMEVNAKYSDKITLDYQESPKVSFSSNHAIRNFDNSLKRRTWFAAFSNYYHSDDEIAGMTFRSPETEFHRTLIQGYDAADMNHFYNFMFNCIQTWKKFNVRIQPSMRKLEQRNLQKAMTDEFLWWAEDYFTEAKLNQLIEKQKTFDEYKATLPKNMAEVIKMQTFKNKLQMFCQYKEYVFNPRCLLRTETEKQRNDIRKKVDYSDVYYFYIDTTHNNNLPVNVILGLSQEEGSCEKSGDDTPLF